MSKKEWAAAGLAIGLGILLQIPAHESMSGSADEGGMLLELSEANPTMETVALDVTGMT